MSRELARLVERHGGEPVCVPAVRECHELDPATAERLDHRDLGRHYDIVVFMTGVAVSMLFEVGERPDGARTSSPVSARDTVCRGPKPTAALRGFGVPPTLTAGGRSRRPK